MSTGFKRQGTAVGANAPSSPYAKTSKSPSTSKHHTTPHDTEFRRPGTTVGPSSSSPSSENSHKSGVNKEIHKREKLDNQTYKEERTLDKNSKKKKKSVGCWAALCGTEKKQKKSYSSSSSSSTKHNNISTHDSGFQKSGSSGVGPHTSHGNNTHHEPAHKQTQQKNHSISPQDTSFRARGHEVGPSNARTNNELAYSHSPRSEPPAPVNAANPAAYVSFCDQCGTKLPNVAKFCDACGAKIRV